MTRTTIDIHKGAGLAALWVMDDDGQRLAANACGGGPTRCTAWRDGAVVRETVPTFTAGIEWLRRHAALRLLAVPRERIGGGEDSA